MAGKKEIQVTVNLSGTDLIQQMEKALIIPI